MKVPLSNFHLVFTSFHLEGRINDQTKNNWYSQLSDYQKKSQVSWTFSSKYLPSISHLSFIRWAQIPIILTGNWLGDFKKTQQQQRNVCFEEPQAIHFKKTGENQATLQLNLELFSCLVIEGGQSQFSSWVPFPPTRFHYSGLSTNDVWHFWV